MRKKEKGQLHSRIVINSRIDFENMRRVMNASPILLVVMSCFWIPMIIGKNDCISAKQGIIGMVLTALVEGVFFAVNFYLISTKREEYYKREVKIFWYVQGILLFAFPFFSLNMFPIMIQTILFFSIMATGPIMGVKRQIIIGSIEAGIIFVHLALKHLDLEHGIYLFIIWILCSTVAEMSRNSFLRKVEGETKISSVKNQAETDSMTTLLNRRGLERRLAHIWPMCIRQKLSVAVIMLDIDNFKKYNDTFGHGQGDECIKAVAKVLKSHTKRKTDYVARVGGEEFLVLLTGIGQSDAVKWAMEAKSDVEKLNMKQAPDNFLPYVSISMGICHCVPAEEKQEFWELRNEADRSLYQAKEAGRACIFMKNQIYAKTMVEPNRRQYMKEKVFRSL